MSPIGYIARIKRDWVRVPLLYLCWPFAMVSHAFVELLESGPAPLFTREFWSISAALFWATHDGLIEDDK